MSSCAMLHEHDTFTKSVLLRNQQSLIAVPYSQPAKHCRQAEPSGHASLCGSTNLARPVLFSWMKGRQHKR